MAKKKGRPPKVTLKQVRELQAKGMSDKDIAKHFNYSPRQISRISNQSTDGTDVEDSLRKGNVENANARIEAAADLEVGRDPVLTGEEPLDVDQLQKLGVPLDQAPFVVASWDLALMERSEGVVRFWKNVFGYLSDAPDTPWDVCVDLSLCRLTNEAFPGTSVETILDMLWRYKPWRGEPNRRAFARMLNIVGDSQKQASKDRPQLPLWSTEQFTAGRMYLMTQILPKRLVVNYLVGDGGLPFSLLRRGRRSKAPSIPVQEAVEYAEGFEPIDSEQEEGG